MDKNHYLLEAFDSLISLVEFVNQNSKVSISEINGFLNKTFSEDAVNLSLRFYVDNLMKSDSAPMLFNTAEFEEYGEEINKIIIFLISNNIVKYPKIGMVIDRLSILNLTGHVSVNDVKRIFSAMIFSEIMSQFSHFEVN